MDIFRSKNTEEISECLSECGIYQFQFPKNRATGNSSSLLFNVYLVLLCNFIFYNINKVTW